MSFHLLVTIMKIDASWNSMYIKIKIKSEEALAFHKIVADELC